jgi:hypothetical protein
MIKKEKRKERSWVPLNGESEKRKRRSGGS